MDERKRWHADGSLGVHTLARGRGVKQVKLLASGVFLVTLQGTGVIC